MTDISVLGAGAFGTALAISLARDGRPVSLIARDAAHATAMEQARENSARLPGQTLPDTLRPTADLSNLAQICLLAVPTQALAGFVRKNARELAGRNLVACCKGVDLKSGLGPTGVIGRECPSATAAILSGPSFAVDIAAGLPTALTIASQTDDIAHTLQHALTTSNLRLYRTTDVTGVEMGGALKNVIAISAGIAIGAGLGESARAALMTRGFGELKRFAQTFGAAGETLSGLSGFGDLVLTCTSQKSRNYCHGLALGGGTEQSKTITTEGVSTAVAVASIAAERGIDMPITTTVAALIENKITVSQAIATLLSRPLKKE